MMEMSREAESKPEPERQGESASMVDEQMAYRHDSNGSDANVSSLVSLAWMEPTQIDVEQHEQHVKDTPDVTDNETKSTNDGTTQSSRSSSAPLAKKELDMALRLKSVNESDLMTFATTTIANDDEPHQLMRLQQEPPSPILSFQEDLDTHYCGEENIALVSTGPIKFARYISAKKVPTATVIVPEIDPEKGDGISVLDMDTATVRTTRTTATSVAAKEIQSQIQEEYDGEEFQVEQEWDADIAAASLSVSSNYIEKDSQLESRIEGSKKFKTFKRRFWLAVVLLLLVLVGVVITIVLVAGRGSGGEHPYPFSWAQIGSDLIGEAAFDQFGTSTALSRDGKILAIGASSDPNGAEESTGHVKVFRLNDETSEWDRMGSTLGGDELLQAFGHVVAISGNGMILAVGAPQYNEYQGQVQVWEWNGAEWQMLGQAVPGADFGDRFGSAVALSDDGSVLACGAWANADNGQDAGHVRVYKRNGDVWTPMGLTITGDSEGDQFGKSMALSSNGLIMVVGACQESIMSARGRVRAYQFDGSEWRQTGQDLLGSGAGDMFGQSVSVSGDGTIVACGGPWNDGNGVDSGHVRIFRRVLADDNIWGVGTPSWELMGSALVGSNADDWFGLPVALDNNGTTLIVGAMNAASSGGTNDSGEARTFAFDGSEWQQNAPTLESSSGDEDFGFSVAISADGSRVVVADRHSDSSNGMKDSGYVRVYDAV